MPHYHYRIFYRNLKCCNVKIIIVLLLRFEDFMAVNINTTLAWDVTLFSLIDRSPSSV